MVRLPFQLSDRLYVPVHGDSDIDMSHEFLGRCSVRPTGFYQRAERVAKSVPANTLGNPRTFRSKTAVAFANSAPVGLPAVPYIGVRDNRDIETPQPNLDEVQKKFNAKMQRVYPRIAYTTKILSQDGKQALAVIIPGSPSRPHFAGLSYVRKGSESVPASEEQFAELIAQRNSKTAAILKSKGQNITVFSRTEDSELPWPKSTALIDCNQFYVTLQRSLSEPPSSFPLSRVEINFDNMYRRLQLEIVDGSRNLWDEQLEQHARQVLSFTMTREGQQLIRHLLMRVRIETLRQFMGEISSDVQSKQMEIAVRSGIVLIEQDKGGLQKAHYVANPQFVTVLRRVLPEILR